MTSTTLPMKSKGDESYHMKLRFGNDEFSYYMNCGFGKAIHQGHPVLECSKMHAKNIYYIQV